MVRVIILILRECVQGQHFFVRYLRQMGCSPQVLVLALHARRPWKIRRCASMVHLSGG